MATFPLVLLLVDFWLLSRPERPWSEIRIRIWPLVRERVPFFGVAGLGLWLTMHALNAAGSLDPIWTGIGERMARVPPNYVFYLAKVFYPSNLSVLHPLTDVRVPNTLLCVFLLIAISLAAVRTVRTQPWVLVGWLWFVLTLLPVSGLVTFNHFFVADRYTYISSIGLTLAVVVSLDRLTQCKRFQRVVMVAIAAVVLGACAIATRADLPRWHDSIALFDAALKAGPHFGAYYNRGQAFLEIGRPDRAVEDYTASLKMFPRYAMALNSRAAAWIALGRYDQAIQDCDALLQWTPGLASAYNNRANARCRKGRADQALTDYAQAIQLSPGNALYYNTRAAAYYDLKGYGKARRDLDQCKRLGGHPHPGLEQALSQIEGGRE